MFLYTINEQISLKIAEEKDAERLFELIDRSREHLRRWLGWLDGTTSVEDTRNFIKSTRSGYSEHRSLTTVILYKGEIVGTTSFNQIDWNTKIAYVGYWLDQEYQGSGIMTKAVEAMINYAFYELNLNRVDIRVAEGNNKSRALPERLGFVQEGKIRDAEFLYDHYVDHIVYGMLASEWNKTV
ncbi:GNAT family N-acetyltransferase [Bacillus sp. AK128]